MKVIGKAIVAGLCVLAAWFAFPEASGIQTVGLGILFAIYALID